MKVNVLDIIDCNAGNHGQAFATNFNPEINIREVTARGRYWEHGQWVENRPAFLVHGLRFSGCSIGKKKCYLMYHEELESLAPAFAWPCARPLLDDVFRQLYQSPGRCWAMWA